MNIVTAAELKRRGMAAIEEGLRRGPLHIVKRNQPTAVVISQADYARLARGTGPNLVQAQGMTVLEWLLKHPSVNTRSKADIDATLHRDRDDWP